ncbi:MAG: RidA family protein [Actinomycetota bacterium]
MTLTRINPPALHDPTPFGYAHTVFAPASSGFVFVAGQYASTATGEVPDSAFDAQLERVLDNLSTALGAHDLDLGHVVQLRTYVVGLDFGALGALSAAIQQRWPDGPPANTVLGVVSLALRDMRIEIDAVAARP